jgi:hypothetical protein
MEILRNIIFYKLFAALFVNLLFFMFIFLFLNKKNK